MTVYSRKTREGVKWRYDFQFDGKRYTPEQPFDSKREAKEAETTLRRELKAGGLVAEAAVAAGSSRQRGVTLKAAADQFWNDIGRHHRSARDIERRTAIVLRLIGPEKIITAIKFADVNKAVQDRRAEAGRNGRPLSPSTVNLDVLDQLRPILRHAARVHDLALPEIDWARARLKVNNQVVREYSDAEMKRWRAELGDPAERDFLHLALRYGPRFGELYFPTEGAFGLDGEGKPVLKLGRYLSKEGVWRESRKDGSLHTLHLLDEDAALIRELVERAESYEAPHVWLDNAGCLISYHAMRGRLLRAASRAGIAPGRLIHGARHHAGTAAARHGLHFAKELLGHRQIETTSRYAHASPDDMRRVVGGKPGPSVKAR